MGTWELGRDEISDQVEIIRHQDAIMNKFSDLCASTSDDCEFDLIPNEIVALEIVIFYIKIISIQFYTSFRTRNLLKP